MAWIKVQSTLPESPKVFRLARLLGVGRMEALGYAVRWFCWLDSHCADGATELLEDDVDALMGVSGITRAFCELEWAVVDANGYVLVLDFDKHNGECAKKRAETQSRVAAHRERQKAENACNAKSVTFALPDKNIYSNNTVVGRDTVVIEAAGVPARTTIEGEDDGFRAWLAGLCGAHPSASKSRVLQNDVLEAARDAYKRVPDALGYVDLLAAYLASKQASDRNKLAFYRPTGQRKFFVDLEDVICHAERWQREFGWGKKPRKGKTVETPGNKVQRCGGVLVGAEAMAFIRGETDEL